MVRKTGDILANDVMMLPYQSSWRFTIYNDVDIRDILGSLKLLSDFQDPTQNDTGLALSKLFCRRNFHKHNFRFATLGEIEKPNLFFLSF